MDLTPFVESARRELALSADPHGAHQAAAERMSTALTPTLRLMLLNALSAAADDITVELAPGSVEVRLRGGEPSFAVTPPMPEEPDAAPVGDPAPNSANVAPSDAEDGPMSRINLRMPEHLKTRIEEAADTEGRSVNAWLVRAATTVLESNAPRATYSDAQRFTGWVR